MPAGVLIWVKTLRNRLGALGEISMLSEEFFPPRSGGSDCPCENFRGGESAFGIMSLSRNPRAAGALAKCHPQGVIEWLLAVLAAETRHPFPKILHVLRTGLGTAARRRT
jgi:hypothetical protein